MAAGRVIIVGGGVSGLATAYFLSRAGIRSAIVEKSPRLGGLIQTEHIQGCELEAGPDSFLAAKTAVTELAGELGELKERLIGSNDERRRIFVVRDGRLVALPQGMVMIAPAEWGAVLRSDFFSKKTKLCFLAEVLRWPRGRARDISVEEFVRSHFGAEVLEYVAEPLLSGVYGGDSGKLSAISVLPRFVGYEERYGSLVRGVRGERGRKADGSIFQSFRGGMRSLTDALWGAVNGSAGIVPQKALAIEAMRDGWRVLLADGSREASDVVLACPAHAAAKLCERAAPEMARELAAIPYSSAILATLVWERSKVSHPMGGFGFLVPRAERRVISAATWVGSKFPSRVPGELAAVRGFIVDPQAAQLLGTPKKVVVQLVREEFERLMGIAADPLFSAVHFWPDSMPQYVLGHEARRANIKGLLRGLGGLHLVGNAYEGVGIPDCVRLAKETAKRISTRIGSQGG